MENSKQGPMLLQCNRPKLLKDFLNDDSHSSPFDFRSYPRKPCKLPTSHSLPAEIVVLKRSKSRGAASSTIFAIHKASEMVVKTLKFLPFASAIKSPSILPRSISRKFSSSKGRNRKFEKYEEVTVPATVKVKVKDILRWKSSRDLWVEEKSSAQPLDLDEHSSSPPSRCTVATTTTSTTESITDSTPGSSKSSSWCDSDFTAEDFPSWCYADPEDYYCLGENGKKPANKEFPVGEGGGVGGGILEKTRKMNMDYSMRGMASEEEDEQYTPVSVLESPFQRDEESIFHRSLANIQRRKCALMQRIKEFESLSSNEAKPSNFDEHRNSSDDEDEEEEEEEVNGVEEKAKKLLSHLKETRLGNNNNTECDDDDVEDNLLLDFFCHELTSSTNQKEKNVGKIEREVVKAAHDWLNGGCEGSFEWEKEGKRVSYVREMERGMSWNNFEEEQQGLGLLLEKLLLNSLVDELLMDLVTIPTP